MQPNAPLRSTIGLAFATIRTTGLSRRAIITTSPRSAADVPARPNTFWQAFHKSYRDKLAAMTLAEVLAYETSPRPG